MTDEQLALPGQAERSLQAAALLASHGQHDFAASRAYYAMFYAAEALLLAEGLAVGKHAAVVSAFGQRFTTTSRLPPELHQHLRRAHDVRNVADYGVGPSIDAQGSHEQIRLAGEFVAAAQAFLAGAA